MFSSLIALIQLQSIMFAQTQQDICIWQRKEQSTTYVNGLYTWNSNPQGHFEKIDSFCPANTLYMYRTASKWRIGDTLNDANSYIAICDTTSNINNPSDCDVPWTVMHIFLHSYQNQIIYNTTVQWTTWPYSFSVDRSITRISTWLWILVFFRIFVLE